MRTGLILAVLFPLIGAAACTTVEPPQAAAPAQPLAGTSWRLAHFDSAGASSIRTVPGQPENYTVEFMTDGSAAFRLDCNRLTNRWTSSGPGALTFGPGAMTRAFCGQDAWDTRIARDLESVRTYTIAGDTLSMKLEGAGGTYAWTRTAQ